MPKALPPAGSAILAALRSARTEADLLALLEVAAAPRGPRAVPRHEWPRLVRAAPFFTSAIVDALIYEPGAERGPNAVRPVLRALVAHPRLDTDCRRRALATALAVLEDASWPTRQVRDAQDALVRAYRTGQLMAEDPVTHHLVALARRSGTAPPDEWVRLVACKVLVQIPGLSEEILLELARRWPTWWELRAQIAASPATTARVVEAVLTPRPVLRSGRTRDLEYLMVLAGTRDALRHEAVRAVLWDAVCDSSHARLTIHFATALAGVALGSELLTAIHVLTAEGDAAIAAAQRVIGKLTRDQLASLAEEDIAALLRTPNRAIRIAVIAALGRRPAPPAPNRRRPRPRRW